MAPLGQDSNNGVALNLNIAALDLSCCEFRDILRKFAADLVLCVRFDFLSIFLLLFFLLSS